MTDSRLGSSFRDPSGFMYRAGGVLLRHVSRRYASDYDSLMRSGLYSALVERRWLVPHQEVESATSEAYRTLRPEVVPYVSYPYEWCFSQLKSAALLTLDIQLLSLDFGMSLKDASAYNVQFVGVRPVFIDTLSFEAYRDGVPWVAYRQFCEHFLGPLALMANRDLRMRELLSRFLHGVPLELVAKLLPGRSWLRYGLLAHLHVHALSQRRHRDDARGARLVTVPRLPKRRLVALIRSLRDAVLSVSLPENRTVWSDYYAETNYSATAMSAKEESVRQLVDEHLDEACVIHDLGANTGRFSRLVASPKRYVVSHDVDDLAVERNFVETTNAPCDSVLPLVLDLTNPSPALGWSLEERDSALSRIAGGCVMALALVHHLAIANNVPLGHLADFFARVSQSLVIEFVPKDDSQVRRLLATREDIFEDYTGAAFEKEFSRHFEILARMAVPETSRTLYAMRRPPR